MMPGRASVPVCGSMLARSEHIYCGNVGGWRINGLNNQGAALYDDNLNLMSNRQGGMTLKKGKKVQKAILCIHVRSLLQRWQEKNAVCQRGQAG